MILYRILLVSLLFWLIIFISYRDTSLHFIYTIAVSIAVWIPFCILAIFHTNHKVMCILLHTFELWIRAVCICAFSVIFAVDSIQHPPCCMSDNLTKLYTCYVILLAIS